MRIALNDDLIADYVTKELKINCRGRIIHIQCVVLGMSKFFLKIMSCHQSCDAIGHDVADSVCPDAGRAPSRPCGRFGAKLLMVIDGSGAIDGSGGGRRYWQPNHSRSLFGFCSMSLAFPAGTTFAFQGLPGAYSDLACHSVCPTPRTLPCPAFEDAFAAVHGGAADYAMIPVENSVAGRVADIHHLLPDGGLGIVGEHFQPIHHHLLVLPGTRLEDVRTVRSHIHALSQCRETLRRLGLRPVTHADTAAAAAEVARLGDSSIAAIASGLAGNIHHLETLIEGVEDHRHNTTRFLILARQPVIAGYDRDRLVITSLVFRVRSVPAALFKALGGFATNGINITKLESYMVAGRFAAAQFYADVEGHPADQAMQHALEELRFFVQRCETPEDEAFFAGSDARLNPKQDVMVKLLGVYPGHPFRRDPAQIATLS